MVYKKPHQNINPSGAVFGRLDKHRRPVKETA